MQRLSESVFQYSDTCNVYVITTGAGAGTGAEAILIDAGDGSVLDHLGEIGVTRVTDVLMTHHHRDQAQGLQRLAAVGARIWVPHQEQDLFHSVDRHWWAREVTNMYNNREDLFSLLEPVAVTGTLKDYHEVRFGPYTFQVVPTPGHTTGSVTLMAQIDGRHMAFTGDLIAAPGKVWSLAATQWSYNGGEGIAGSILSLLDLKERHPELLLPSHGAPMAEPAEAMDLLITRLADLRTLRRQNPRLFLLRETPFEAVTPHLLKNRTSMSDAYVLLSESGKALFIDFGYDFMFGTAAGSDRSSRRPWLYNLPTLKAQYGVTKVDVVIPTHYHDDHVAGFNLLRAVEGTATWVPDLFAELLEEPHRFNQPCLWYDPIPVDRRLPLHEPLQWEEYTFTLYPLPGHTYYAVAIAFEVDGRKVLATGDQQGEGDGLFLNYIYKNGFRAGDYRESGDLYRELKPDVILTGHWGPFWVREGYLEALAERGRQLEEMHRELLLPEAAAFIGGAAPAPASWAAGPDPAGGPGLSGFAARIRPYRPVVRAGQTVHLDVHVQNPQPAPTDARVTLVLPSGWTARPLEATVKLAGHGSGAIRFAVTPPAGEEAFRARVAADITIGEIRLGQQAEALVTIHQGDELDV